MNCSPTWLHAELIVNMPSRNYSMKRGLLLFSASPLCIGLDVLRLWQSEKAEHLCDWLFCLTIKTERLLYGLLILYFTLNYSLQDVIRAVNSVAVF